MTRINQIWALIFVFIVVFLQGSMINLTSIILPTLGEVFKLDMESQGRLQSFGVGGMMVSLFLGGIVTRSIGARLAGVSAITLMGAGAMVMAKALSYELVLVAMFVMGLGIQLVLSVHSWVVSAYFYEQRQRLFLLIMAMMAVGAMVGPYLFGVALDYVGPDHWQRVYLNLALILWTITALIVSIGWRRLADLGRRSVQVCETGSEALDESKTAVSGESTIQFLFSHILRRGALYLLGLIVIFDNLAMWSASTWMPTLAQETFDVDASHKGSLMSIFAGGVLLGRLLMATFLAGKVSDYKLLGYSYGASMLMFMLLLTAPTYLMLVVAWFLVGLFMSAQAAMTYAIAVRKFKGAAGIAIPIADGIGSLAMFVGPPLFGSIADAKGEGIRAALWLVPVFGFLLSAISLGWEWVDNRTRQKPQCAR